MGGGRETDRWTDVDDRMKLNREEIDTDRDRENETDGEESGSMSAH